MRQFQIQQPKPVKIQPKLQVNQPGDSFEQEADAMADKVMAISLNKNQPITGVIGTSIQRKCARCEDEDKKKSLMRKPESGIHNMQVSSSFLSSLASSKGNGSPLPGDSRKFMENAFSSDFSAVRVHTDSRASGMSQGINAKAFTYGSDIYFNAGQFAPNSYEGKKLLAHELMHVLQQDGVGASISSKTNKIQRQSAPTTPAFSVNQANYLALVQQALGQMSGNIVNSETLASTVLPILQLLVANVSWKDASGTVHGGGRVRHQLPTGVSINLQLILNDDPASLMAGEFSRISNTDGKMEIFIQHNPDADTIAETMYHEAMHMVSWLINRARPALNMTSTVRGPGIAGAVGSLDQRHWSNALRTINTWLTVLKTSVNSRRASTSQISTSEIDLMSAWLLDEIHVRAEAEVFRLAYSTQQALAQRGPSIIIIGTGTNWRVNISMVDKYVFDFSGRFLPSDRAGLTPDDRHTLDMLMQILEGLFQSRVKRRFSPTPYIMGRGIPRAQVQWTPPPLTPPPFAPLPVP